MTQPEMHKPTPQDLPEAVIVESRRGLSMIWFVPLVAVLIGAWLILKAITEKGPTITITFETAADLEVDKTKIKYKDVVVGQVKSIRFGEDFESVVVAAEMDPDAGPYLTENTRFWVVRARVAAGEVQGLGTLFSGAYIGMDPSQEGESAHVFKGLEAPPIVRAEAKGRRFVLQADRRGSLDIGSPIYFRQIEVGKVTGYQLKDDERLVDINIYIFAPHDRLVHKNTRFWNASGIDFTLDARGVRVDTQSLVSIVLGGIAFDTPETLEVPIRAEEDQVFRLYASQEAAQERTYSLKRNYILLFDGSVRGLGRGAPVEFRGIKIGRVLDIKAEADPEKFVFQIPVLIEIEPERIELTSGSHADDVSRLDELVEEKGLRAQLQTGNLLTGALYVEIDFHPNTTPAKVGYDRRYPVLPTIPTPLERVRASLTRLVNKLEKLPLEQIGEDLRQTVQGVNQLVNSSELRNSLSALNSTLDESQKLMRSVNSELMTEANATIKQANKALLAAERILTRDSPLNHEVRRVLEELSSAARSIRVMADYLERNPNALIYGKGRTP